jgi:signal transduction histidine kinase/ActR/RegA family two-component response regulator
MLATLYSFLFPPPEAASGEAHAATLRGLRRWGRGLAGACLGVAAVVMAGWMLHAHALMSVWSGWATMKFNTALAIAMLAAGLILQLSESGRSGRTLGTVLQALALALAVATGLEILTGIDFGIDQALMSGAEPGQPAAPGRMAPATSVMIAFLALASLLSPSRARAVRALAALFNWSTIWVGTFALFGYAGGPHSMYETSFFQTVSFPTAVTLTILGICATLIRPEQMPVSLVADPGLAGRTIRATLPWLILGPVAVALLVNLGAMFGLYNPFAASGLVVLLVTVMSALIILRSGVALQRTDRKERDAAVALRRSYEELEERVDARTAELRAALEDVERARRDAEAARREAEGASKAKSEFLSSMSHELRTPLNAVIGFAQLLEMNRPGTLTAKQREYSTHIVSAGHHLLSLVNEVLDLAGIEAGRMKMSIERVVVADAFDAIRSTMQPLAAKNKVTLAIDAPAGIADIRADDLRLRQILINLVSNGIKYNHPGGKVTLSASPAAGGMVRLSVTDTGIGISPEDWPHLFEPFERLGAEVSGVEGTGIGLALSRKLAEAMGGAIGFASETGRGSTFWIDLPAESGRASYAAGAPAADAASARALAGGYSLLYIEDNAANLRLMEDLVATLDDVVMLAAPTPQLGLDLAVAHRPDVIVLDINLPGMSGYEVLARLKAMPETRDTPVLALTAAAFPQDVKKGLAAGFFAYIPKPLDVKAFLAAVGDALAASSARKAAGG